MLILAMDANFWLKNRMRTNDRKDPELGPGWAYFVASGPYKNHIKNYVSEEDVSVISYMRKWSATYARII